MKSCLSCRALCEDDSNFCDRCGSPRLEAAPNPDPQSPAATPDGPDEPCPACGGRVEIVGQDRGVCRGCGLELAATEGEAPAVEAKPGLVKGLTQAIASRLRSGVPLDAAVAESLALFGISEPADAANAPASVEAPRAEAPQAETRPAPRCPVCRGELEPGSLRCSVCGLYSQERARMSCPACSEESSQTRCACGAILTLPRLLEGYDDSVRWVCRRCKQLYTAWSKSCPDCSGELLPADGLRAAARIR